MALRLAVLSVAACQLAHAQPQPMTCNQVDGDYVGCGVSKSTYSATDPIAAKKWMEKYFPVGTPSDECPNDVCHCNATADQDAWQIQQGRVYMDREATPSGNDTSAGDGFGLHLVNVSEHLTTGGLSTAQVEAHFTSKLGDMSQYDSFMDFNVVFSTSDLQGYKQTFKADGVKYLAGSWHDENGTEYTSIIFRVSSTQLILELVQSGSLVYAEDEAKPVKLEQRVPSVALAARRARLSSQTAVSSASKVGAYLVPLVVNRAASAAAMSKLDDFYVTGMRTTKTLDSTKNDVSKKCFLWAGATGHVCFTSRPDTATTGEWKVKDFEDMLNNVHKTFLTGHPNCPMDKWLDNHYAYDNFHNTTFDATTFVSYVNQSRPYYWCMFGSLHYIVDPTGWAVQLNMLTSSETASLCSTGLVRGMVRNDDFNPACTVDTSQCPSSVFASLDSVIV